jgi:hypothetical protein
MRAVNVYCVILKKKLAAATPASEERRRPRDRMVVALAHGSDCRGLAAGACGASRHGVAAPRAHNPSASAGTRIVSGWKPGWILSEPWVGGPSCPGI